MYKIHLLGKEPSIRQDSAHSNLIINNQQQQQLQKALQKPCKRNVKYAFQLCKQFYLFSENQSDFSVSYIHMRQNLQNGLQWLKLAYEGLHQRRMLEAFIKIGYNYQRKLKTYNNYQNINIIIESIGQAYKIRKKELLSDVFSFLLQEFLVIKKVTNFKTNLLNLQQGQLQQNRSKIVENALKIQQTSCIMLQNNQKFIDTEEKLNFINEYYIPNNSNINKQSSINNSRVSNNGINYQVQFKQPIVQTPIREYKEYKCYNTVQINKEHNQKNTQRSYRGEKRSVSQTPQNIYIVRDYKSTEKKGKPSKYIRIPILSHDIQIYEMTSKEYRKSSGRKPSNRQYYKSIKQNQCRLQHEQHQFNTCKYCSMLQHMRQCTKTARHRQFLYER